jgi:hypothetical protein
MSDAIVYLDVSDVREGALDELKAGMKELAAFVEANVPRIIAYHVSFSDDGTRMTVMHVHPDPASLENHLEVAGPMFRRLASFVTLRSIQIYGEPSERALERSRAKADLLGRGRAQLVVEPLHAGFTRFASRAV